MPDIKDFLGDTLKSNISINDLLTKEQFFSVEAKLGATIGGEVVDKAVKVTFRAVTGEIEEQITTGGKDGAALPVAEQLALIVTEIEGVEGKPDAKFFKRMPAKFRDSIAAAIMRDEYPNGLR